MATVTGTLTVNAAFLQEIKDDNRQLSNLLAALRKLTGTPDPPPPHQSLVVELLVELCDQLAFHFALEEAYGYFDEAIDVAPRVAEQADELRAEHRLLFESIRRIAEAAEEWRTNFMLRQRPSRHPSDHSAGSYSFRRLLIQFWQFDDQLQQHESKEDALILDAHETDIGGEG